MRGLVGSHDDPVADRQEGEVGAVELPDQLHIAEDRGVPGVVELEAALELYDVAHRRATVDHGPVLSLDARGVEGVRRSYLDPPDLGCAAYLDRRYVLDALALEVGNDLEVGDRRRAGLSRDRNGVGKVVEVPVGYEHRVELVDLPQVFGDLGIVGQEWIYQYLLAPRGDEPERRVPEVGDPGSA